MAHFSAKLSLAVLIPALFLPSALGQTLNFSTNITYNPQLPIPGVGHDYIHMVNETVNPADGNVSVDINIPLPAGRGLSVPFSIVYSSSNFGVMQRTQPNPYGSASNGSGNWSFLSSAGWSYTLPMLSYVMAYRHPCKSLSRGNAVLLTRASEERAHPHSPASAARNCASRRWFL
ncbi:MAG: hypothetical protein WA539_12025, partial [Candidatus Sulfotelmatobacter sp.]